MLDTILLTLLILVWAFQVLFFFIPLGNENSIVRRLPIITFAILALNTIIYFVSLPVTVKQDSDREKAFKYIKVFIDDNRDILADENVRNRLKATGLFAKELTSFEERLRKEPDLADEVRSFTRSATAIQLRAELQPLIEKLEIADQEHLYNQYGLVRDGKYKAYQLLTYSFLHSNSRILGIVFPVHLLFNLIMLFAVAFSLEDLWGRPLFLGFFLLGAVVSAIPDAVSGTGLIGASGAVSALMGAFLVRLPKTRMKMGWVSIPLALPMMAFGKKSYGVALVKSYYYMAFFFLNQILLWWFFTYKTRNFDGVSYRCHIAGFIFGAAFAFLMKAYRIEEKYINPKIEAKIAYQLSPKIAEAIHLLDTGAFEQAESKLKALLVTHPGKPELLMALAQVYEKTRDYDKLNTIYTQLIRHHIENSDKEAALYAYDNLLLAFPDNKIEPNIPAEDWFKLCEYLEEIDMRHEAAIEYFRFVRCCPDDAAVPRACVQGAEAAFASQDIQLAIKLFEKVDINDYQSAYAARARIGLAECKARLTRATGKLVQPTTPLTLPPNAKAFPQRALNFQSASKLGKLA
ncbi:MAG: rhomboid family intramembrane serine protease [Acidobacteriota bacterium]